MADIENILRGVHFDKGYDMSGFTHDGEDPLFKHFLQPTDLIGRDADSVTLLGFGSPYAREGGFAQGDVANPITELQEVPEKFRNIDLQGKGVGPRMYNTPQAALALTELPPKAVNAYLFDLDPDEVLDARPSEGSSIQRIARHASRMIRAKRGSLEAVVDEIHAGFDGAGAVLMSQPPNAARRERSRREHNYVPEVPSEFIIIRSAVRLRNIGFRFHPSRPDLAN